MSDRATLNDLQQRYYDHIAENLPDIEPFERLWCATNYTIPHTFVAGTKDDA